MVLRPPEMKTMAVVSNTTIMVILFFYDAVMTECFKPLRQSIFTTFPVITLGGVTVYDIGVTGFSSSVVPDLVKVSLVRVLAALLWDQWLRPPLKWLQCHSKGSMVFDLVSGGCRCTGPCDCPAGKETDITYLPSIKTFSGTFWLTVREAFVMTIKFFAPCCVFCSITWREWAYFLSGLVKLKRGVCVFIFYYLYWVYFKFVYFYWGK